MLYGGSVCHARTWESKRLKGGFHALLAYGAFYFLKRKISLSTKDTVEVEGEVTKNFPNAQFRVRLDSGQEIMAHLSGRMRVHRIRILPGDRVRVALSPYDLARGRIILRLE